MQSRFVSRRAVLTTLFGAGTAGAAIAQQTILSPQSVPQVMSGSDLGFRVERTRRDGVRVGTLVVKVEDKWVEAEIGHGIRFGTTEGR